MIRVPSLSQLARVLLRTVTAASGQLCTAVAVMAVSTESLCGVIPIKLILPGVQERSDL